YLVSLISVNCITFKLNINEEVIVDAFLETLGFKVKMEAFFLLNANLLPSRVPKTLRCCRFHSYSLYEPFYIDDSSERVDGVDVRPINHVNEALTRFDDCKVISNILLVNTVAEGFRSEYPDRDYPYFFLSYSYFVERAGRYNRWSWFTSDFRNSLWILCILSLGTVSTAIRLLAYASNTGEGTNYNSTCRFTLNLWSSLWGAGAAMPHNAKIKIILIFWLIFCICLNTVFQTYVTSYFVVQTQKHQIDSVEEIEQEGFTVIVDPLCKNPIFDNNKNIAIRKIGKPFLWTVIFYNSALYTTKGYFKYNAKKLCKNNELPSYHKFITVEDSNYFVGMFSFLDPLLQRRVNIVIERLATAGIVQKIWNDIVDAKEIDIVTSLKSTNLDYEPMGLFYLQLAFYVQVFGLGSSGIVFFTEIALSTLWKNGPNGQIILVFLHFGNCIKLKLNRNEEVISDAILEVSKKFFDHNQPIAFLPRTVRNSEEWIHSRKIYWYKKTVKFNVSKCNNGFPTVTTDVHPPIPYNGTAAELFSRTHRLNYSLKHYDKLTLKTLLMSENWSIFISSDESITSFFTNKNFIGFIYNWWSFQSLADFYELMNASSRTILILIAKKTCPKCSLQIINKLKLIGRSMGDVLILSWKEGTRFVNIETFLPYEKPFGFCGDIREMVYLDTWVQSEDGGSFLFNANLRPNKVPKILRCCRFVSFGLYEPFYINDSLKGVDGVDVRLLNHVNEVFTSYDDCREDGKILLVNTVSENLRSDYPGQDYPYISFSYSYFVEKAGKYNRWSWFTSVFRNSLWTFCIVSLGIASLAIRLFTLARYTGKGSRYNSTCQCIMNLWSVLWGAGAEIPQDTRLRAILISWILFCLCLNTVFQTYVTSYFVVQTQRHQIDTVEEIIQEGYTIVVDPISRYPTFHNNENVAIKRISQSFLWTMNVKKSALYTTEESQLDERNKLEYSHVETSSFGSGLFDLTFAIKKFRNGQIILFASKLGRYANIHNVVKINNKDI
ncbi:hypothetical protein C0J52_12250, partial [Blattella germanica]